MRWRLGVLAAGCCLMGVACRREPPKAAEVSVPRVSLAALDSQAVAGLAVQFGARPWTLSLPHEGTVTKQLDAAGLTRAFVRGDSMPVVFAGSVVQVLSRVAGKVVVLQPDYHDAPSIADFELWAACPDSLAALAARQQGSARPEVALVSRVRRVERLVWENENDVKGVRDRFYVEGSCLAIAPLPQHAE